MYEYSIYQELQEQTDKLESLNARLITIQQQIISGDTLIEAKIEENNNNIIMINMILMITLLFTFIMRCFK